MHIVGTTAHIRAYHISSPQSLPPSAYLALVSQQLTLATATNAVGTNDICLLAKGARVVLGDEAPEKSGMNMWMEGNVTLSSWGRRRLQAGVWANEGEEEWVGDQRIGERTEDVGQGDKTMGNLWLPRTMRGVPFVRSQVGAICKHSELNGTWGLDQSMRTLRRDIPCRRCSDEGRFARQQAGRRQPGQDCETQQDNGHAPKGGGFRGEGPEKGDLGCVGSGDMEGDILSIAAISNVDENPRIPAVHLFLTPKVRTESKENSKAVSKTAAAQPKAMTASKPAARAKSPTKKPAAKAKAITTKKTTAKTTKVLGEKTASTATKAKKAVLPWQETRAHCKGKKAAAPKKAAPRAAPKQRGTSRAEES
ncbi:hypothetical protein B0H13DRAFT_1850115 [Mycena leptocephala]|nr:hypothetical protein B0H13DRAFT_1850115 [Mycena leptocephala]